MSSINDSKSGAGDSQNHQPDAAFGQAEFNFGPDKTELEQARQNAKEHPSIPRQEGMKLFGETPSALPKRCELFKMLCEIIAQPGFEGWKAHQSSLSPGNELNTKTATVQTNTGQTLSFEPIEQILRISGIDKNGHEIQFIKPNLDDPQIRVDFPEKFPSTDGTHLHLGMNAEGCIEKETLEAIIREIGRHNFGGREMR